MTKEEKIKEAFGESWNLLNRSMQDHILNVHHWVDRSKNRMNLSPTDLGFDEATECEVRFEFWRPIQLKGIEDNNGWKEYNFEALPKDIDCHVINDDGDIVVLSSNVINSISKNSLVRITHYQTIAKPNPPVY